METNELIYKRALMRCTTRLIEDLDFDSIIDYLITKEAFPNVRIKDMREEKYSSDKVRKLLENIQKAGPEIYKLFLDGLKVTKQGHLRTLILNEEKKIKKENVEKTETLSSGTSGITQKTNVRTLNSQEMANRMEFNEPKLAVDEEESAIVSNSGEPQQNRGTEILAGSKHQQRPPLNSKNVTDSGVSSRNLDMIELENTIDGPPPVCDPFAGEMSNKTAGDVASKTTEAQNMNDVMKESGPSTAVDLPGDARSPQYPSLFGNLSSYVDMHADSEQSSDKGQQQFGNPKVEGRDSTKDAYHNPGQLPIPSFPTSNQTEAPDQPNTEAALNTLAEQVEALDTSDRHKYLWDHFDACVIYTEGNRNRADEIVHFVEALSGNYKICCFDDEEYFGLFNADRQPVVISEHCVLILIVISNNLEDDEHAKYLSSTITMLNKNKAQIRPVVFCKEEKKLIPGSMANTTAIPWYDKDKEHVKKNLLSLLEQCKKFRKPKEDKGFKSKKDMGH